MTNNIGILLISFAQRYILICDEKIYVTVSEGPHCAEIVGLSADYSLIDESMSVTYCVQLCKGQQLDYALLQNFTCSCVDTLPALNIAAKNECLSECPGNKFQYCGGDGDKFSVYNGKIKFYIKYFSLILLEYFVCFVLYVCAYVYYFGILKYSFIRNLL